MDDIINKIVFEHCDFIDYIKNYDKTKIIIYGAGFGAIRVISFLKKIGIIPSNIVVDKEFYRKGSKLFDYPIEDIEYFFNTIDSKVDIIICFDGFQESRLINYNDKIRNIGSFGEKC